MRLGELKYLRHFVQHVAAVEGSKCVADLSDVELPLEDDVLLIAEACAAQLIGTSEADDAVLRLVAREQALRPKMMRHFRHRGEALDQFFAEVLVGALRERLFESNGAAIGK